MNGKKINRVWKWVKIMLVTAVLLGLPAGCGQEAADEPENLEEVSRVYLGEDTPPLPTAGPMEPDGGDFVEVTPIPEASAEPETLPSSVPESGEPKDSPSPVPVSGEPKDSPSPVPVSGEPETSPSPVPESGEPKDSPPPAAEPGKPEETTVPEETEGEAVETSAVPEETLSPEPCAEPNGFCIVIDAGHQKKGNSEKEPIGPGATEMKAKVAGGTYGATSGLNEYELTLMVAQKLEEELINRGYQVIMVRTTHDVDMSNSERAQVANDAQADAFIRIHANGSEKSSVNGAMTICQTAENPYNADYYQKSRDLSVYVLDEVVAAAGCKKQYVWETDTMSGINWCQVPVTIVEMGYMTNPEEDALMATEEYQEKLACGMANGIDKFLSVRGE